MKEYGLAEEWSKIIREVPIGSSPMSKTNLVGHKKWNPILFGSPYIWGYINVSYDNFTRLTIAF